VKQFFPFDLVSRHIDSQKTLQKRIIMLLCSIVLVHCILNSG